MNLRARMPADMPALTGVLRRVRAADDYPTVWPEEVSRWITGDGGYGAWVAVLDGKVVGHVGLARPGAHAATQVWIAATQRPAGRLAEVTRLFTDPGVRGCGAGRRLLQQAVQSAHALALWPVLDVRHDGRPDASRLYETAGWRLAGSAPLRLAPEVVIPFDCWIGPPPPAVNISRLPDARKTRRAHTADLAELITLSGHVRSGPPERRLVFGKLLPTEPAAGWIGAGGGLTGPRERTMLQGREFITHNAVLAAARPAPNSG